MLTIHSTPRKHHRRELVAPSRTLHTRGVPPLHIFIVEDHADTLQGIRIVLEMQGHQISSAASIGAALAHPAAGEFDLLLSDISLPDGDGWDLMRELRRQRPVRGIAMSGLGMKADRARSKDSGFSEHMVKPFTPEDLDAAIARAMAGARAFKPNGEKAGVARIRGAGIKRGGH